MDSSESFSTNGGPIRSRDNAGHVHSKMYRHLQLISCMVLVVRDVTVEDMINVYETLKEIASNRRDR